MFHASAALKDQPVSFRGVLTRSTRPPALFWVVLLPLLMGALQPDSAVWMPSQQALQALHRFRLPSHERHL